MKAMNEMKPLLEKYFSGETSNGEEAVLHEYFMSDQIDDEYQRYIPLFEYIREAKQNTEIEKASSFPKAGNRRRLYLLSGVAAAMALLAFGLYHFAHPEPTFANQKSFVIINGAYSDDPEQVHYYAAQAIDRYFEAERAGLEDTRNAIYQLFKAIDDCLAPFDAIINLNH